VYRVYRLNVHERTFPTRDEALVYVYSRIDSDGNYEILDESDF
jgi:hypothetical protein